jgi:hypothetical protein
MVKWFSNGNISECCFIKMKKLFSFLLLLFSSPLFSQLEIKIPEIISLDSFNGKFSRVEMKSYPADDTLPAEKKNIVYASYTINYTASGAKSSTRYQYQTEKPDIDTFMYNRKGNLIQVSYGFQSEMGSEHIFRADGKEIYTIYYEPECDGGYDTLKYDRKGNLIAIYSSGQVGGSRCYFHYDKNGKMYLQENFNYSSDYIEGGTNYEKDSICRTFDTKGRLISEKHFTIDCGKLKKKKYSKHILLNNYEINYSYSQDGRTVVKKYNDSDRVVLEYDSCAFSTKGSLLSELTVFKTKDKDGKVVIDSTFIVCTYDTLGFLKTKMVNSKYGIDNWRYETVYNTSGNPQTCIEYYNDKKGLLYKWEYFPVN